jgi:hypothetical protein
MLGPTETWMGGGEDGFAIFVYVEDVAWKGVHCLSGSVWKSSASRG